MSGRTPDTVKEERDQTPPPSFVPTAAPGDVQIARGDEEVSPWTAKAAPSDAGGEPAPGGADAAPGDGFAALLASVERLKASEVGT